MCFNFEKYVDDKVFELINESLTELFNLTIEMPVSADTAVATGKADAGLETGNLIQITDGSYIADLRKLYWIKLFGIINN